jgi:hypothetical protein
LPDGIGELVKIGLRLVIGEEAAGFSIIFCVRMETLMNKGLRPEVKN